MKALSLLSVIAVTSLAGCGSMSGLDAKDKFACAAPDGVLCESMSGIYANAQQNNLPGQQVNRKGGDGEKSSRSKVAAPQGGVLTKPVQSGTPIRSAPLVLRVWFAPWEDTDGDLHDQSYVYLQVDSGRWLIEHNRRRIQDTYRPVRAPAPQAASTAGGDGQHGGIKVRAPAKPGEEGPQPTPQNAQELLRGMLNPGMQGSPLQAPEYPE
jgi:conjugal transfer pilus assembly protein TraV